MIGPQYVLLVQLLSVKNSPLLYRLPCIIAPLVSASCFWGSASFDLVLGLTGLLGYMVFAARSDSLTLLVIWLSRHLLIILPFQSYGF